jgi:mannose-6-phosphate isomerase-like protein (cupin superfamily)
MSNLETYARLANSMADCESIVIFRQEICVLMQSATSESGNFCFELNTPPGLGMLPHRHEHEDEVAFIIEGELEVQLDGRAIRAVAGDTINMARGTMHGFWNTSTKLARTLWVVSPGAGLEACFEELKQFPEGTPPFDLLELMLARFGILVLGPGCAATIPPVM